MTATSLADVQGPLNNLPNGGELQVRGLVVTDANAFSSAPFTTLVSTVQTKPGTEVKPWERSRARRSKPRSSVAR